MRFKREQVDKSNDDAYKRGYRKGKVGGFKKGFIGFVLGVAFGIGGFYLVIKYPDQIASAYDSSKDWISTKVEEIKNTFAQPMKQTETAKYDPSQDPR